MHGLASEMPGIDLQVRNFLLVSSMFAIIVTLECHPGREAEMIRVLESNATGSREESGCLKWEWSQQVDAPCKFGIYELYKDEDAITSHKASEHFAEWRKSSAEVVASKSSAIYEVKGEDTRPLGGGA